MKNDLKELLEYIDGKLMRQSKSEPLVKHVMEELQTQESTSRMDLNLSGKWLSTDDDKLINEYDRGKTIKELGNMFQIDIAFIRSRLKKILLNEEGIE